MKRVLLSFVFSMILSIPAFATVTVEQTTDAEFLINSGYSQRTAEEVFVAKNRVNGKAIEPLYEEPTNAFVRCWRKFYSYLDPAQEQIDSLHHDIKMSPSASDL